MHARFEGTRGEIVRRRRAGEFCASEIAYRSGSMLGRHQHAEPYVSVLLDGSYTELCNGVPHACAPGTVIVHPGAEVHADYFVTDGRCINIDVPPAWLAAHAGTPQRRSLHTVAGAAFGAAPLLESLMSAGGTGPGALERMTLALVASTTAPKTPAGPLPAWLVRVLEQFTWVAAVPLERAAYVAGVHQAHFSRAFRQHMGVSPGEFRMRRRLQRATQMLLETRATLSDVAGDCGFSDQSHFANAFRAEAGLAPGAFRSVFAA